MNVKNFARAPRANHSRTNTKLLPTPLIDMETHDQSGASGGVTVGISVLEGKSEVVTVCLLAIVVSF